MDVRIQKLLSDQGIASRRKAEEMIEQGRIKVNGHPAVLGQKVNPARDVIAIDGVNLQLRKKMEKVYLMLNKPRGYVTTLSDEMGRRCVAELVEDAPEKVYPVGRLDKNSEGALFFTNDGEFANLIMHPSHHISKTYRVTVRPDISDVQAARLAAGVEIDGRVTAPAQVRVLTKEPGRVVLEITIYEGRNRQVRKMCEAVGLEVARLKRTSIGPVKLGMLPPGQWRELTPAEVGAIRGALRGASPEEAAQMKAARLQKPASQAPAGAARPGRPQEKKRAAPAAPHGSADREHREKTSRRETRSPGHAAGKPARSGGGKAPFGKKGGR